MSRSKGTNEAGYGYNHKQLRASWDQHVQQGNIACSRCRTPIVPGEPWDLGHDDDDRTLYTGPEHQHCNRSAAAHKKNGQLKVTAGYPASRDW
jgi:hypothetical protein